MWPDGVRWTWPRGGEIDVAGGYVLGASAAKIGDKAPPNKTTLWFLEIPGGQLPIRN